MAAYYDFAGQRIIKPGAYTKRYFPAEQGLGNLAGRVLILGEASKGGIPFDAFEDVEDVINTTNGQAQALNIFGGGDIYYGAEFFLTPTKDERFNTPSQADCIVVNQMTQASGTLQASAVDIIDVKYKIEAAMIGNHTVITTTKQHAPTYSFMVADHCRIELPF